MNLPRVKLVAAGEPLDVYVARNAQDRSLGLMYRTRMEDHEGMLFVCDAPEVQRFWMKDTPLALSIAFIEEDGTICKVADMEPHSLESQCSDTPVRFILEVRQGWFARHGVGAGTRIEGPVFVAARVGENG